MIIYEEKRTLKLVTYVTESELNLIMQKAKVCAGGNMALYLRYCGIHFALDPNIGPLPDDGFAKHITDPDNEVPHRR